MVLFINNELHLNSGKRNLINDASSACQPSLDPFLTSFCPPNWANRLLSDVKRLDIPAAAAAFGDQLVIYSSNSSSRRKKVETGG